MSAPAPDVSRETRERLDFYLGALKRWNPVINLVSRNSLADGWTRHIEDSLQLIPLAGPAGGLWLDLGSGGGLPGLVVAIAAPGFKVVLVESDGRKAAFLSNVVARLGLDARVVAARIEDQPPFGATVLSARALAPLDLLLAHAARHLSPGGIALFPKGEDHENEIAAARRNWSFDLETTPSRTNPGSVILKIGAIERARHFS